MGWRRAWPLRTFFAAFLTLFQAGKCIFDPPQGKFFKIQNCLIMSLQNFHPIPFSLLFLSFNFKGFFFTFFTIYVVRKMNANMGLLLCGFLCTFRTHPDVNKYLEEIKLPALISSAHLIGAQRLMLNYGFKIPSMYYKKIR